MVNRYTTREAVKERAGKISAADTADDNLIDDLIEAVSREIENYCGRWFYPTVQTRYYRATGTAALLVDDLLAVSTLKTDDDGDRTYETTWATTDYDTRPDNARNDKPARPYWELAVSPDGNYSFPTGAKGIEVVGTWGYYDERTTPTSLMAEALDATETAIDVDDGTEFKIGHTILVDSEQMFISGISTNTLTVTRGVNDTTGATHSDDAAIQIYEYPVVSEACLAQCQLAFRLKDAPMAVAGGGEFAETLSSDKMMGLHPFVRRMLGPLRRPQEVYG